MFDRQCRRTGGDGGSDAGSSEDDAGSGDCAAPFIIYSLHYFPAECCDRPRPKRWPCLLVKHVSSGRLLHWRRAALTGWLFAFCLRTHEIAKSLSHPHTQPLDPAWSRFQIPPRRRQRPQAAVTRSRHGVPRRATRPRATANSQPERLQLLFFLECSKQLPFPGCPLRFAFVICDL